MQKQPPSSHWGVKLAAVVLDVAPVNSVSQRCVLHQKQDVGSYSLREVTSSELPPETSRPFSWKQHILSSGGSVGGRGDVWKVKQL